LQYLIDRGYVIDEWTTANVAKLGFIKCLKILHPINNEWSKDMCAMAAYDGQLECLI